MYEEELLPDRISPPKEWITFCCDNNVVLIMGLRFYCWHWWIVRLDSWYYFVNYLVPEWYWCWTGCSRRNVHRTLGHSTIPIRCTGRRPPNCWPYQIRSSALWAYCMSCSVRWQLPYLMTVSLWPITFPVHLHASFSSWSVVFPENVAILGSDDATSCIIVVLRHSGKATVICKKLWIVNCFSHSIL